jgi:hypothetical protein
MFLIRLFALLFITWFGWTLGQLPPHELNLIGKTAAVLFFVAAPALYLLPLYEAWRRQHRSLAALAALNVLLGWTLLGWVGALVWALASPAAAAPAPAPPPAPWPPGPRTEPPAPRATRRCPFCAEDVLAEAVKCKHCGSDLRTAPPPG